MTTAEEVEDWDLPPVAAAEKTLQALRDDSATGPDGVPTRVLKRCAAELAGAFLRLAKTVLRTGRWPTVWLQHWVVPLHKRNATWKPSNYRGVHLTAQLAKATERLLQHGFRGYFTSALCTGENQFAYRPGHGARDALAFVVLTWISGFCYHKKFVVYCSDVSGAFDRVSVPRLLEKLRTKRVPERWVTLFASWLRDRPAKVVVGGKHSQDLTLSNMVFQGTVWGPLLWNLFYEDAATPVREAGFEEAVYADDLNAFKEVPVRVDNSEALERAKDCQLRLHAWGRANQVSFDSSKESFHVLSHRDPAGGTLKLLGVPFDCKLDMAEAIHSLACEAGWKLRILLKTARFHYDAQLVDLYKSKLLGYLEYRTPAVYHATDTALAPLDRVQLLFCARWVAQTWKLCCSSTWLRLRLGETWRFWGCCTEQLLLFCLQSPSHPVKSQV